MPSDMASLSMTYLLTCLALRLSPATTWEQSSF